MQDEGNALAPRAGFFNNPLKGGVITSFPFESRARNPTAESCI